MKFIATFETCDLVCGGHPRVRPDTDDREDTMRDPCGPGYITYITGRVAIAGRSTITKYNPTGARCYVWAADRAHVFDTREEAEEAIREYIAAYGGRGKEDTFRVEEVTESYYRRSSTLSGSRG